LYSSPKDDNVVSLNFYDNLMDNELLALASGFGKLRYAALKKILSKRLTKACSVLKSASRNSLVLDLNKSNLFAADKLTLGGRLGSVLQSWA
jgi:hypothetical protein